MIKHSVLAILAIAGAGAALPALAQSTLYGIVGAGRSTIDVDPVSVNTFALNHGLTTSQTSTSTKDAGWKLQLGYGLSDRWALEFGYMNLGKSELVNVNNLYSGTGHKKADLFNIDFVARFPFGEQWSLIGRVGGYRWETESVVPTSAGMTEKSDDGFDFKFGAGLQYDFTRSFALRGSYDRFNGVGSTTTTGDSKYNLLSLDAVLKF